MQITIKAMGGQTIVLDVSDNDTVGSVKAQLVSSQDIPVEKQRLLFADTELEDDESTLKSCGVKSGAVISLILRKSAENMKKLTESEKKELKVAQSSQVSQYYNASVGLNDELKAAKLDKHNNPIGGEFDLGKDGEFGEFVVILGIFYTMSGDGEKIKGYMKDALERKGFFTIVHFDQKGFQENINKADIAIIISSNIMSDNADFVKAVSDFHTAGGALYIFGDNDPWYAHANALLPVVLKDSTVKLIGNTPGYKVLKLGEATKKGCFGPHIITTGIINLFEGVTICYPSPLGPLKVLATSTDGNPTVCYADNEALKNNTCGRIMVDCAFTKLYINWDDAGTARYIINSCIWLLGIEHKVLMGMPIQGKGVLNVAKDGDRVRNPKYQKDKESNNNNDSSANKKSLFGTITSTVASLVPSFASLTTTSTSSVAPIEFTAKAELVVVENEAGEGSSTAVQPEYASLNVTLSSNIDTESSEKPRWLILVADQSGSMQGNPWTQVQGALEYMLETSYKSKNIRSDVIMYNGGALILTKHCTPENFVGHIKATSAFGQTNFRAAYDAISNLIDSRAGKITPETDVSIVFMTDGAHTSKDNCEEALEELRDIIQALPCSAVVHAVGFSLDHNYSMLREITTIGKEQGAYQYAEPGDGPDALKTKLESIFDYATIAGEKVNLTMTLEGYNFVTGIDSELTETKQITSRTDTEGDLVVGCTVLPKASGAENLKLNLSVDAQKQSQTLTVDIKKRVAKGSEIFAIKLKRMDQQLEAIVQLISSHTSPPTDTEREKYLAALQSIQQSLREYEGPALLRLNKDNRELIVSLVQTMRNKLTQLFETIAAWARGQWTTQNRARLADIAYSNMFAKGNRQRRMDARVAKNAQRQKEESNNLEKLKIDEEQLKNVSQDSLELYNCVLRLSNWKELAMDKDSCGFGLAVGRPEFVVDDSTQLRVFQISNTFCSKSAIEDSIKYSIDVQGQVATTGGFGIGNEVGVATRGMSREPINAWLPLYIHQQHWDIVKIQLRSILGYFVALDPLGFSMDQVDSLFLVLGTMISRCAHSETHSPGERELLLLLQYMRTCEAVAKEMKWFPKIEERLRITIERIHYDSADQVKNLLVVVGYLAILPEDTIKRVFPNKSDFAKLWVAILAISARRSGFTIFKNLQESHVRLFLDQVLYGDPTCYNDSSNNGADILGVQRYENLLDDHTLVDDNADTPTITESILQYGKAMDRFGYPTISSIYTCLSFYLTWKEWSNQTTKDPSVSILAKLDDTYGVANEKWISFIKEKFASNYNSNTPTIIGFLETVDKNFGLPHSVTSIARAVVAQGILYRVNKAATAAFEAKTYMNTIEDPMKCLNTVHNVISGQRKALGGSMLAAQKLANLVNTTIARTDIGNFVQSLHSVLPNASRRDNSFKALLHELTYSGAITSIPFAVWKLRVIISGKYPQKVGEEVVESDALDGGALWIPGRRYTLQLSRSFGDEIFVIIQQTLATNTRAVWGR